MTTYIIRRLIQSCIVVILVTMLIFLMVRLLPGDPVLMYISADELNAVTTEAEIAEIRHELGLDKPLYLQYVDWFGNVVKGDLGDSLFMEVPVLEEIALAMPKTLTLGLIAWLGAIGVGITFGVIAAVRRGTWIDTLVTFSANIGVTAPVFWVGIILIHIFGVKLGWLPVMGYTSIFDDPWMAVKQMIMPVFCLALFPMAGITRQTRSSMLEVVRQDFIRTAWAKGLSEYTITMRHALRNSIIPVVTFAGIQIRNILGGAVLIESVFNISGMGLLAVDGLLNHDYAIVQGVVLIIAIITTLINLVVDISYGYIDPRIRYS